MSTTVTLQLDAEVMQQAEREARARKTTVSEVVTQQLKIMAQNWTESQASRTPITDELHGSLRAPGEAD